MAFKGVVIAMLFKIITLISRVDYIDNLQTRFWYKSELWSFSLITVWHCDFLAKGYHEKIASIMLMKLKPGTNQRI